MFNEKLAQTISFEYTGLIYQLLLSKNWDIFTVYSGTGYSSNKTKINIIGDFYVNSGNTLKDPLSFEVNNSGVQVNLGMRFKFGFFSLNTEYSYQTFETYTLEMSFGFR